MFNDVAEKETREIMIEQFELPIFPLSILPIPNERVPLHIFEPRYKQLLEDVEEGNNRFGIYYSHGLNKDRLGALVELEVVSKRYNTGESDIIVKCIDTFLLTKFYNKFYPKLYPGGVITPLKSHNNCEVSRLLGNEFNEFLKLKGLKDALDFDIHDIANELKLNINDRLKYIKLLKSKKREAFLRERLRYKRFILEQEKNIKDNFFLN